MKNNVQNFIGYFGLLLLVFSCNGKKPTVKNVEEKPNIVLINIDDLGWADLAFQGSDYFETPNLDALSKKGMVFTNGYASAANCAPSRAGLMTGQWAQRHKIYTVGNSDRGKTKDRKLIPTKNTIFLADSFEVIPQTLQKNGYKTCHAGKWHVTKDPLLTGFDVNIGGSGAGHPGSYYPPYKNVKVEAKEGQRLTDAIMDKTVTFIKQTESPFFLNYSPYAVHTPIQPVPELVKKYEDKPTKMDKKNAEYATMIQNMDENVGRLLATLKETGKLENTFIIFTSDNGGLYRVSKQHPLRAGKGSYYDGGIRVPFFFVWDNKIKAGQESDIPISNLDLYPTILEVAGIEKPKDQNLDGQSLLDIVEGNNTQLDRPLFWHFPIYLQAADKQNENRDVKFRTRPGSAVRYGDYKLHHYFEDNGFELYNLKNDIGEKNNLIAVEVEKANEMKAMLSKWQKETNAPIPTEINPDYKGE